LGWDLLARVDIAGSFLVEETLFAALEVAGLDTLETLGLRPDLDLGINSIVYVGIVGFLLTAFEAAGCVLIEEIDPIELFESFLLSLLLSVASLKGWTAVFLLMGAFVIITLFLDGRGLTSTILSVWGPLGIWTFSKYLSPLPFTAAILEFSMPSISEYLLLIYSLISYLSSSVILFYKSSFNLSWGEIPNFTVGSLSLARC
jgi:hypothetical protein